MVHNPYSPPAANVEAETPQPSRAARPVNRMRVFVATLIAPCVVVIASVLIKIVSSGSLGGAGAVIAGSAGTYLVVVFVTATVALPLYLILKRWNLAHAWIAAAVGFAIPALAFVGLAYAARKFDAVAPAQVPMVRALVICLIGSAAGYVFWLVAEGLWRSEASEK